MPKPLLHRAPECVRLLSRIPRLQSPLHRALRQPAGFRSFGATVVRQTSSANRSRAISRFQRGSSGTKILWVYERSEQVHSVCTADFGVAEYERLPWAGSRQRGRPTGRPHCLRSGRIVCAAAVQADLSEEWYSALSVARAEPLDAARASSGLSDPKD
jgi:hypothetical protein